MNELHKWSIRVHKSLKEVFTSVAFYQESLIAKESRCWNAFYFQSYYSLFHSLMACVVLIPFETIEQLSNINHTKLIKVFKSNFCDQSPRIMPENISELFYMLKYLREYYSYNMPMNDFLYDHPDTTKPDLRLTRYIRGCAQLASLHSELIDSSAKKHGIEVLDEMQYYSDTLKWYQQLNCPKHPESDEYILHYTDKVKIEEIVKYPEPLSFITDFEHFVDEFRTYEGGEAPRFASGKEINPWSFLFKTLHL